MVIRIVMTIASEKTALATTPKIIPEKDENRGEKGAKCPCFVKD